MSAVSSSKNSDPVHNDAEAPDTDENSPLPAALKTMRAQFLAKSPQELREFLVNDRHQAVNDNINVRFDRFKKEEVKLSKNSPATLVSPSGSLLADICLLLHYPTFDTAASSLYNGTTGDDSNSCVRILLRKGFNVANTLYLDRYCRRASPPRDRRQYKSPMDFWDDDLRQAHCDFSDEILEASLAKVCLVFGRRNREDFQNSRSLRPLSIRLCAGIDPPDAAMELDENGSIKRLLIFCWHPEWLLRGGGGSKAKKPGILMDQTLNLAAALVNLPVDPVWATRFSQGMSKAVGLAHEISDSRSESGRVVRPREDAIADMVRLDAGQGLLLLGQLQLLCDEEEDRDTNFAYDEILKTAPRETLSLIAEEGIFSDQDASSWCTRRNGGSRSFIEVMRDEMVIRHNTPAPKYAAGGMVLRRDNPLMDIVYREAQGGEPVVMNVYCKVCSHRRQDLSPLYRVTDSAYLLKDLRCSGCDDKGRTFYPVNQSISTFSRNSFRKMTRAKANNDEVTRQAKKLTSGEYVEIAQFLVPKSFLTKDTYQKYKRKPNPTNGRTVDTFFKKIDAAGIAVNDEKAVGAEQLAAGTMLDSSFKSPVVTGKVEDGQGSAKRQNIPVPFRRRSLNLPSRRPAKQAKLSRSTKRGREWAEAWAASDTDGSENQYYNDVEGEGEEELQFED